jgi:hypothetical protein
MTSENGSQPYQPERKRIEENSVSMKAKAMASL